MIYDLRCMIFDFMAFNPVFAKHGIVLMLEDMIVDCLFELRTIEFDGIFAHHCT